MCVCCWVAIVFECCHNEMQSTVVSMTMRDDPIREWIVSEGKATQITGTHPVGGGCINRAYRYETDVGSFFVKTNRYNDSSPYWYRFI